MSLRRGKVCSRQLSSAGRSRHGFTLIELLVVISVIMLLISLLLPALGGAREAARAAACMSNQRQILTGLGGYLNANRDVVPREGSVDPNPLFERDYLSWAVALRPYVDERASIQDDLNDLFEWAPYYRDPSRRPDGHRIHFMANAMPFLSKGVVDTASNGLGDYRYRRGPTPLSRLRFPEQTAYIGEYADDVGGAIESLINALPARDIDRAQYYDVWEAAHIENGPMQRITAKRHGDGGNLAFIDGHCKAIPSVNLVKLDTWDDGDYGRRRGGN
jgi:prepilin-type N-terminal cleavage/methylation domain-containing protein/prepilin-type processing-associated H-X9-DG protein